MTASGAASAWVQYVEVRSGGADLPAALLALLPRLRQEDGYVGAEVLDSPEQPGLHLLAVRWARTPPELPLAGQSLPGGARHWSFRVTHREGGG